MKKGLFVSINADTLFRILRVLFLVTFTLLLVYLYSLYTKGKLVSTILLIWNTHKGLIMAMAGFCAYTIIVYRIGFNRGRGG